MTRVVSLDFETCSAIKIQRGAPRYASDPTTRVLIAAWAIDNKPPKVWIIGDDEPAELLDLARDPNTVFRAFNAAFERNVWHHAWARQWPSAPAIPIERWTCTMTRALVWGLPRSLEHAGAAIGALQQKDVAGAKLMLRMSKPQRDGIWHHEVVPEDLTELASYCIRDVEAERAIARKLPPTPPETEAGYHLNQRMNTRGLLIDQELVRRLLALAAEKRQALHERLSEITLGTVTSPDQREKLLEWLHIMGVEISDLRRQTVAETLRNGSLNGCAREALQIRADGSRSSVAKLQAMLGAVMADGRIRDPILFHGSHTGRASGAGGGGTQFQNFVRSALPKGVKVDDVIGAALDEDSDVEDLEDEAEVDGLAAIASMLRGCVVAGEGNELVACDFAGIEARVLAWISGNRPMIDVFRSGEDIYLTAAAQAGAPGERMLGKVVILALGYGQGPVRFVITARGYGVEISEERAQEIVWGWREANPAVTQLWKQLDDALRLLATTKGDQVIRINRYVSLRRWGSRVLMRLPGGREMVYRNLRLEPDAESRTGSSLFYDGAKTIGGKLVPSRIYGAAACLAGDTFVLTHRGWKQIVDVAHDDRVWDGEAWVAHDGLIDQGVQSVIEVDGVWMTPDHQVLTAEGWRNGSQAIGSDWARVRLPDSNQTNGIRRPAFPVGDAMRMRAHQGSSGQAANQGNESVRVMRQQEAPNARHVAASGVCSLALDDRSLQTADTSGMEELRRPWNYGLPGVAGVVRTVLDGYGADLSARVDDRAQRQRRGLQFAELPLGHLQGTESQSTRQPIHRHTMGKNDGGGSVAKNRNRQNDADISTGSRRERVYDLLNTGRNHQFVIAGLSGPIVSHNCENLVQAAAYDLLDHAMRRLDACGVPMIFSVHDEIVAEVPADRAERTLRLMKAAMSQPPAWAEGLPLKAEGWRGKRFRK